MVGAAGMLTTPLANADNSRLNNGVIANVYTIQHQAGCTTDLKVSGLTASRTQGWRWTLAKNSGNIRTFRKPF
jgi:hypothetical protein